MDLTIELDGYKLNIRAGAVIIHNHKILLHKNINSDHYALIGGRMEIGESSEETIKREILEETGKEIKINKYIATIENFFEMKGYPYHEIMFVHQAEFIDDNDQKIETTIQNKEGKDYLKYEWIDLDQIDNINLLPNVLIDILKEGNIPVHKINNELKQ